MRCRLCSILHHLRVCASRRPFGSAHALTAGDCGAVHLGLGSAFNDGERDRLALRGLLPSRRLTFEDQIQRVCLRSWAAGGSAAHAHCLRLCRAHHVHTQPVTLPANTSCRWKRSCSRSRNPQLQCTSSVRELCHRAACTARRGAAARLSDLGPPLIHL